ncbi:MAG TPA: SRPBCC family protein [Gemmatimonadaceae bacterium]|nr:SRPBCC family protein [Gemmatimonadaceae bacterium]
MMTKPAPVTYTTPSDREVVITREVNAPRRLVWEAWTNPKHVPNWLTGPEGWTMPVCEMDLRVGGRWRFVWRNPDGGEMAMTGVYTEIVPPEILANTERWGPEWPETQNTVRLVEKNGKTTITITILYESKQARDAALQTGMKDGMDRTFERLDEYLSGMQG